MEDEDTSDINPILLRKDLHQIRFHSLGGVRARQAHSLRQTVNMGVNDNASDDSECLAQNNISRLSPYARQENEFLHRSGDFATMLLY